VASAGHFAYVTSAPPGQAGSLAFVDLRREKTFAHVTVGQNPQAVALGPGGRFAYVANEDAQSVSVVDVRLRRVVRTLAAGIDPVDVAVARPGGHKLLLVVNKGPMLPTQGSIDVWNLKTMRRIAHVVVNFNPLAIAVLTTGHRALVGDGNDGFAFVLDLRQLRIVKQVTVPAGPVLDLAVGRRLVYLACAGGISVLRQSTLAPVGGVVTPVFPQFPSSDAASPADVGYVVNAGGGAPDQAGALQILSGPNTVGTEPLSTLPDGIALTSNSRTALVTAFNDGTLWLVPLPRPTPPKP
jgi:YVTN family beta-propeller protein